MKNSLFLKIIFYLLLIAVALAAGMLLDKNLTPNRINATVGNEPTAAPVNANVPSMPGNRPVNAPLNRPPAPPPAKPTCLITIDGQRYDVQPLRGTHSGGDVFKCNTDMSAIFHGQHGDNLRMIQRYLVK